MTLCTYCGHPVHRDACPSRIQTSPKTTTEPVHQARGPAVKPPCPDCGYRHSPGDTYALNRFNRAEPIAFRAAYDGAPNRTTRAAAEADMCRWRRQLAAIETKEPTP